jgi:two-component system chemotaxis response regulator CheY
MRILVVEDDFTSRHVLCRHLDPLGVCEVATDGEEAVEAVQLALEQSEPYGLICLDIMMPRLDGQGALKAIRDLEEGAGIALGDGAKILITSALGDHRNVMEAFRAQCDGYLVKPYERGKLGEQLARLGIVLPPAKRPGA